MLNLIFFFATLYTNGNKGHLCLRHVFSLITKMCSESFDMALSLLLTHVICMKPTLSCLIVSGLCKTYFDVDVIVGLGCYCFHT